MTGGHSPGQSHEVSPYVEFSLFQLSDSVDVGAPLSFPAPGERLFTSGPGGVLFGSAGNDFYPTVQLELWAREAPAAYGEWDLVQESSFDTRTGRLRFRSVNAVPAGDEIVLPTAGTYSIRPIAAAAVKRPRASANGSI